LKYLFCFGYENPDELETNKQFGTDFESSNAVWVQAENEQAALTIGIQYAKKFVSNLFKTKGIAISKEWSEIDFACWIEDNPQSKWSDTMLDAFKTINL
jgi:hypothetical protein